MKVSSQARSVTVVYWQRVQFQSEDPEHDEQARGAGTRGAGASEAGVR